MMKLLFCLCVLSIMTVNVLAYKPGEHPCNRFLSWDTKQSVDEFASEILDRLDEVHINNHAENWPLAKYSSIITDVFSRFTSDATFTILPGRNSNNTDKPVLSVTGRTNLINTFIYVIRGINGGEVRSQHKSYVYCTDFNNFHLVRTDHSVTMPLVNNVWTGNINVLLSRRSFDITRTFPKGDFMVASIVSDQRNGYTVASNQTEPFAQIHFDRYYE